MSTEINYNELIKEGVWFHKTDEKSPSIEVSGVDHHRKVVYIGDITSMSIDPQTMSFDDLLRDYQHPSLEQFVSGGKHVPKQSNSLLGGLSKEGDEVKSEVKDEIVETIENSEKAVFVEPKNIKFTPSKDLDKNSTEYRMISDTISLSRGSESAYEGTVDVKFSFDIDKVSKVAKMFDIDSEKVADIVLSDSDGVLALKEVFVSILKEVISKEK